MILFCFVTHAAHSATIARRGAEQPFITPHKGCNNGSRHNYPYDDFLPHTLQEKCYMIYRKGAQPRHHGAIHHRRHRPSPATLGTYSRDCSDTRKVEECKDQESQCRGCREVATLNQSTTQLRRVVIYCRCIQLLVGIEDTECAHHNLLGCYARNQRHARLPIQSERLEYRLEYMAYTTDI